MFDEDALLKSLNFKAVRSSGSGGQHVNKVASKVELLFNLNTASVFNESQRALLYEKLKHKISKEGVLVLQCDEFRSQHRNKALVIQRFLELIKEALTEEKERIPTKTPKGVIERRLKNKRYQSEKKANRKNPDVDL
ncbi:alternative ribosome rescue aminoacyl-tRNA hydrolase ArfB [Flavobacteriaceae bacterium MHTCC 0001]